MLVVSSSLDCFKKENLSSVGLSGADCDTIVHNFWSENVGFFAVKLRLFQILKSFHSNSGYVCSLYNWLELRQVMLHSSLACSAYRFHTSIIALVHVSRDFAGTKYFASQGFEPLTFWLVSSCLGITFPRGIRIFPVDRSPCPYLLPVGTLGNLKAGSKTTVNITKSLYIQLSSWNWFTYNPLDTRPT